MPLASPETDSCHTQCAHLDHVLGIFHGQDIDDLPTLRLCWSDTKARFTVGIAARITAGIAGEPAQQATLLAALPAALPAATAPAVGVAIAAPARFKVSVSFGSRTEILSVAASNAPVSSVLLQTGMHASRVFDESVVLRSLCFDGAHLQPTATLEELGVTRGAELTAEAERGSPVHVSAMSSKDVPMPDRKPGPARGSKHSDKHSKPELWTLGGEGPEAKKMEKMAAKVAGGGGLVSTSQLIWCSHCCISVKLANPFIVQRCGRITRRARGTRLLRR